MARSHVDHGADDGTVRRLGIVAAVNLVGFAVELVGGLVTGSVALVADALHMLFDALAYVVERIHGLLSREYGVTHATVEVVGDRHDHGLTPDGGHAPDD